MGVLPRRLIKQNLSQVEVFLEDTRNDYFAVQDIPDTFTQGRSSFKIFGSDFLKGKRGDDLEYETDTFRLKKPLA